MTQDAASPEATQAEIQQQAGKMLTHIAGLVGARTIEMGRCWPPSPSTPRA